MGTYPTAVVPLVSFMNMRTSEAFGLPSAPVDTVKSNEPIVWRAARDTRSAYCVDIFDALPKIASSSAIALCWSSMNLAVKSSIYVVFVSHSSIACDNHDTYSLSHACPGITCHIVGA